MRLPFLTALLFAAASQASAAAQDIDANERGLSNDLRNGDNWEVELGLLAAYVQDYPGADALQATALPYFYIEYKDSWFLHPTSGAGYYWVNDGNTFVSSSLSYSVGRQESDTGFLAGMGDLDGGIALRSAAQFDMTYFVLGGFITHQISGDDTGTEATFYASTRLKPTENFRIYPTVRVALVDEQRNQAFFGVTAAQAATSAFPVFTPGGGVKSYGLQFQGLYDVDDKWRIAGQASWDKLSGDAADSPLTQDDNQYLLSLGVIRTFN